MSNLQVLTALAIAAACAGAILLMARVAGSLIDDDDPEDK